LKAASGSDWKHPKVKNWQDRVEQHISTLEDMVENAKKLACKWSSIDERLKKCVSLSDKFSIFKNLNPIKPNDIKLLREANRKDREAFNMSLLKIKSACRFISIISRCLHIPNKHEGVDL